MMSVLGFLVDILPVRLGFGISKTSQPLSQKHHMERGALSLNSIPGIMNDEIPVITGLNWGNSTPQRKQSLCMRRESEVNLK